MTTPVLVAWSGGKDSWLALVRLQRSADWEVAGLISHLREGDRTLAMHRVPQELVAAQAASLGFPLDFVLLPDVPPNDEYERRLAAAMAPWLARGVRHIAYGDLFLADIRAWRDASLARLGITPVYPVWGADTHALARQLASDTDVVAVCVDTDRLDASFAGRIVDAVFLDALPPGIDPCGENGEFHTFVRNAPGFAFAVPVEPARTYREGRFAWSELAPGAMQSCARCGAPFTCGAVCGGGTCWCVSRPPVAIADPNDGCYCPRCLAGRPAKL